MYFLIRHRLNGLVVRLALWSGEVPGSNQGGTFFYEKFFIIFHFTRKSYFKLPFFKSK